MQKFNKYISLSIITTHPPIFEHPQHSTTNWVQNDKKPCTQNVYFGYPHTPKTQKTHTLNKNYCRYS